jgi:YVTN family beta-propeller protein
LRHKGTGYPGYALVAAAADAAVSVVDLRSFRLAGKIDVHAEPSTVLAQSGAGDALAITGSNGTLHLLDLNALTRRASFRIADDLAGGRLLPDGRHAVVISRASRQLLVVDLAARRVSQRFRLAGTPAGLDLAVADTGAVRVAVAMADQMPNAGTVEQFELQTGAHSRQYVSSSVGSLRYRRDAGLLFVANYDGRSITVLDGRSLSPVADLPLALRPEQLCFNADDGQLFVTGAGMDGIAIVFTYQPLIVEQTVLAGRAPGPMACSGEPEYLFVASKTSSEVSILSVLSRQVIAVVEAGQSPRQILMTPDNQYALILYAQSGALAVIRIPTITRNRSKSAAANRYKSAAALFTMIPVGDQPVGAAIASIG